MTIQFLPFLLLNSQNEEPDLSVGNGEKKRKTKEKKGVSKFMKLMYYYISGWVARSQQQGTGGTSSVVGGTHSMHATKKKALISSLIAVHGMELVIIIINSRIKKKELN